MKQGSIRKFPIERPIVSDTGYHQEDDINLYMDTSRTPRSIKGGMEGSVRSSKGLSHSKTAEKGKFLTASDLNLMKQEVSKKQDLRSKIRIGLVRRTMTRT